MAKINFKNIEGGEGLVKLSKSAFVMAGCSLFWIIVLSIAMLVFTFRLDSIEKLCLVQSNENKANANLLGMVLVDQGKLILEVSNWIKVPDKKKIFAEAMRMKVAVPMGFEPMISSVTGKRPLQTGLRDLTKIMAQGGGIEPPTHRFSTYSSTD